MRWPRFKPNQMRQSFPATLSLKWKWTWGDWRMSFFSPSVPAIPKGLLPSSSLNSCCTENFSKLSLHMEEPRTNSGSPWSCYRKSSFSPHQKKEICASTYHVAWPTPSLIYYARSSPPTWRRKRAPCMCETAEPWPPTISSWSPAAFTVAGTGKPSREK